MLAPVAPLVAGTSTRLEAARAALRADTRMNAAVTVGRPLPYRQTRSCELRRRHVALHPLVGSMREVSLIGELLTFNYFLVRAY